MQCPVCRLDQVIVEIEGVEIDVCIEGHGVWFDADELRQLFEVAGVPDEVHDLEERLQALAPAEQGRGRRCPRCGRRMERVQVPGAAGPVVLDRCRHGDGLWFDEGELEAVLGAEIGAGAAWERVRAHLGRFVGRSDEAPRRE